MKYLQNQILSWLSVVSILFGLSLTTSCSPKEEFTLTSKESDDGFDPGGVIPNNFRDIMRRVAADGLPRGNQCKGRNEFPKLTWSNIPPHTEALVLIVEDPTGGNWVHLNAWHNKPQWEPLFDEIPKLSVVNLNRLNNTNFNIPSFPEGWQIGDNSWSAFTGADQLRPHVGWAGPCPPNDEVGAHTYYFKLYALNSRVLSPINNMTRSTFEALGLAQIIGETEISGTASFGDPRPLTLTSSEDDGGFDPGEAIPDDFKDVVRRVATADSMAGHQCDGRNEFPKLTWSNIPEEAEALVLIVEDETGSNWVHLNAWYNKPMGGNLPNEISKLSITDLTTLNNTDSNVPAFPTGWQTGMNSWSTLTGPDQIRPHGGWGGPCPPQGPDEHAYYFKLYALNAQVDPATPIDNMNRAIFEMSPTYMPQIIAQAEIFGTSSSLPDPPPEGLTLTSSLADGGFEPEGVIPDNFKDVVRRVTTADSMVGHQCNGRNEFPKLTWTNIPAEAEALVLIVEDETGSNWVHLNAWYNKPMGGTLPTEIAKLSVSDPTTLNNTDSNVPAFPAGWQTGMNSWSILTGANQVRPPGGWAGLCPPNDGSGSHTYYFKLYALNAQVDSTAAPIDRMTRDTFEMSPTYMPQIIGQTEIFGTASFASAPPPPAGFTLTSSLADDGFDPGGAIPDNFKDVVRRATTGTSLRGYQCNGRNEFPKLTWTNIPTEAEALVLIVEDETNSNWVHLNAWYNKPMGGTLPTEIAKLSVSDLTTLNNTDSNVPALPTGWQTGMNSWSTLTGTNQVRPHGGWAGPCPAGGAGAHTYYFKLYALNAQVDPTTPVNNMNRNAFEMSSTYMPQIIGQTEISGTASASLYVAVGNSGTILSSTNGAVWESRTSGTADLHSVTYANNTFVAVGDAGTVISSADGITWTTITSGTNDLYDIIYTGSRFVAVGLMGGVTQSTDLVTWSASTLTPISGTPPNMSGVAFSSGRYIVSAGGGVIIYSTDDFATFSTGLLSGGFANLDIIFANNLWVIVRNGGGIVTSMDGNNFSDATSGATEDLTNISFGRSQFLVVGTSGRIITSGNGTNWTAQTSGTANLNASVIDNDRYIIVGDSGTILMSSDGTTWANQTSGVSLALTGITVKP